MRALASRAMEDELGLEGAEVFTELKALTIKL
jgi:hypothetical protein